MKLISTASQARELDRRVIQDLGVPGVALMELAARGVAEVVRDRFGRAASHGVVVVCGAGNNGGDGYACARWLHGWGVPVRVWSLSPTSAGDAGTMRAAWARLHVREVEGVDGAGLLVDAVFGTGLTRAVAGEEGRAIRAMNALGAPIVAVDLPSGLHADTGAELGVAVRATCTVTFGRLKPGLLTEPGADLAGDVSVVDIGLGCASSDPVGADSLAEMPDARDLARSWPIRAPADHKTRSGQLLVLAGSRNMTGAAVLACRGALAVGVGLLTLAAPRGAIARLAALPPEAMVLQCGAGDHLEPLREAEFTGFTAVAAGPGLGGGLGAPDRALGDALGDLWARSALPLVYDADALAFAIGGGPGGRVVTPHPGEAGRLLGLSAAEVQADRFGAAARLADGRTAILKGRYSLVASPGTPISVNPTNTPVLATGGTGDVLLGMVGGLLARGVAPRDAARLAAWAHGRAGERLAARRSQGWTAGDVAAEVPDAIEELLGSPSGGSFARLA
jgi:NAD(P)H-hydrate epimerase